MYEQYKQFCEVARDNMGNRLSSDLTEQEIKQWDFATNKLAFKK